MKTPKLGIVFLASMAATAVVGISLDSQAWVRTIEGHGCVHSDWTYQTWDNSFSCAIPSDTTMSASAATHIYTDVFVDTPTTLYVQACRATYLHTVVACGTNASASYTSGAWDIPTPLWGTSGASQWDYYWTDVMSPGGVAGPKFGLMGVSVQGP